MMNWFYGGIFIVFAVILGQYNKKIGLALAALILLGAILFNKDKFIRVMEGGALK